MRPRDRPSDVARGDLKAVLRILYCLFVKDKGEQGQEMILEVNGGDIREGEEEAGGANGML